MNAHKNLLDRITQGIRPGAVEWIGIRESKRGAVLSLQKAQALSGKGLDGDHRVQSSRASARQVTIINQEDIQLVAKLLHLSEIDPALMRRNIVVSGINLNALRYQQFKIGEAVFEAGALCHPCSRMDKNLGPGGHAAMLGHGGLCAKVLESGEIRVGDTVSKIDQQMLMDI